MRNPTQADVARMAGVSRGLVSLALAGRPGVSSATRRRLQDAADGLVTAGICQPPAWRQGALRYWE